MLTLQKRLVARVPVEIRHPRKPERRVPRNPIHMLIHRQLRVRPQQPVQRIFHQRLVRRTHPRSPARSHPCRPSSARDRACSHPTRHPACTGAPCTLPSPICDSAAHPSSQTIPHTSPGNRCGPHESTSAQVPQLEATPRNRTFAYRNAVFGDAPFHAAESSTDSRRDTAPSSPPTPTRPPAPSPSSASSESESISSRPVSSRPKSSITLGASASVSFAAGRCTTNSPSPLVRLFKPSKLPRPA